MKAAFAKMMEKNPTQSSHIAFRAGGNGVPILTRASSSSTNGYQTMGLPDGSRPMPGGGANKTSLGAFRMGDQDGNGPASAIYAGEIFGPYGQPDRVYPERTFANVGNNTFQPQNDDAATHALLKRLGDQQFKAVSEAPFEDYRAQQRLARDLDEASRNASLSDLGTSREIIRNLAAERRQQNEDDYLRKMLDAGATPEAAKKEIEDVRNANALQEARKVDDREYQAKTLINRIALSRGITPMGKEPLTQSSSIDNPQRSQAMSQAMGMPGEGFGTSPLDANRQFVTPEFYKRYLRKSAFSQESADEQSAFNTRLADGEIPAPAQGAYSFATLKGQERQNQVEMAAEGLASRLETLRARGQRIIKPLPSNVVGKDILDSLYKMKGEKKPSNRVLYSLETIQDMRPLQLLIALNLAALTTASGGAKLNRIAKEFSWGTAEIPSPTLIPDLKSLVTQMNSGESNIEIPFASAVMNIKDSKLVDTLQEFKNSTRRSGEIEAARVEYEGWLNVWEELIRNDGPSTGPLARPDVRARNQFRDLYTAARDDITYGGVATVVPNAIRKFAGLRAIGQARDEQSLRDMIAPPPAFRGSRGSQPKPVAPGFTKSRGKQPKGDLSDTLDPNLGYSSYSKNELKDLARKRGLAVGGNISDLIARLSK